jgi:Flp pilus assembly protein TadG
MEAALVMPLLLIMTFGAIEFGFAFYVKHTVQGAAREGARAAIVSGATPADVTAAVDQAMKSGGLSSAKYTLAIKNAATGSVATPASLPAGTGVAVEVKANWSQFATLSSGFSGFIGGDLTGKAVMRRES